MIKVKTEYRIVLFFSIVINQDQIPGYRESSSPSRYDFRQRFAVCTFRHFTLKYHTNSLIFQGRNQYVTTFLERDIPQLGINIPARTLRRFWTMLSHYHGQILNYSERGRS